MSLKISPILVFALTLFYDCVVHLVNSQLNDLKVENERLLIELSENRKKPTASNIPVSSPAPAEVVSDDGLEAAKGKAESKKRSRLIKVPIVHGF